MIRAKLAITPERWERIKQILEAALDQPAEERWHVASRLCDGDSQLESEVRNLLSANDDAGSFLNIPAAAAIGCTPSALSSSFLEPATMLAHRFEILRFINSGGMGEVYEARDAELQESVALKTIRPAIASNGAVIERFKAEVRQSRGISHPNICRVYDLFSDDNAASGRTWFLTMQLLRGETLLERLRRDGPFPPAQALDLVRQMVAGLAAAHELGIVHGDFKSGNVMLMAAERDRLQVVITDFGLALNLGAQRVGGQDTAREGTPAYMAPEQWRGERVGVAIDQYALGIVICEMLSGKRPEPIERDGAPGGQVRLPPDSHIPLRWRGVLRRCLQPNPVDRFANVNDLLAALDPRVRLQKRRRIAAVVAMLVIVCAIVFALAASAPDTRLENLKQITASTDLSASPSLSRDGKMIAYESDREEPGNLDIYVERLPDGNPVRITNDPAEEKDPDISPDGKLVVYRSDRNGGGVYLASTADGREQLLAPSGKNPRFSPDGKSITFWTGDDDTTRPSGRLYVMPLESRVPIQLASDFRDARLPTWSSDGRFILFTGCRSENMPPAACSEWWVTSADGSLVRDTGSLELLRNGQIVPFGGVGRWQGDTVLFTARQGSTTTVWELNLPLHSLRAQGKPHRLTTDDVRELISSIAFAESDVLAVTQLSGAVHVWEVSHINDAPPPVLEKLTEDPDIDICPAISPDGKWLVFLRGFQLSRDLWIRNMESGKEWKLTTPQLDKFSPIIDNSGGTVVYEAKDSGVASIFVTGANHETGMLCHGCSSPSGWLNSRVLYRSGFPSRIMVIEPKLNSQQEILLEKMGVSLAEANWSPESQYLLFTASSNENTKQIFAIHYPVNGEEASEQEWIPITPPSEWSDKPRWSSDGKIIYYLSRRDGHICLWAQHFDRYRGVPSGEPVAVMHFHDSRKSLSRVTPSSLNVTVAGDHIYLDLGEANAAIWTGILQRSYFQRLRQFLK